jgi:hypothetical protein
MKTGVEMIADKRADICTRTGTYSRIPLIQSILGRAYEHFTDERYDHAIRCLAESGAMIAAEIDRINKFSTK